MEVTATENGVKLELDLEEAIALEQILGYMNKPLYDLVPWYDDIANVLEETHLKGGTIADATSARFVRFHTAPMFWDDAMHRYIPDNRRARQNLRKPAVIVNNDPGDETQVGR